MNIIVSFSKIELYTKIQFGQIHPDLIFLLEWPKCICVPFLHSLMKRFSKILINLHLQSNNWWGDVLFIMYVFFFISVSDFLDRFNPIYPLKHAVKSHWISLNNCIISKSWKHFLTYQVNIHKMKQRITLITVRSVKKVTFTSLLSIA